MSKSMSSTEREALKKDFDATFEGVDHTEIDAEDLYNWAIQTRGFYQWFYGSFEATAKKHYSQYGSIKSMEVGFKVPFLYWAAHEIITPNYAGFLHYVSGKVDYLKASDAAKMVYQYYLDHFKESNNYFEIESQDLSKRHEKTVTFKDNKGVIRRAVFSAENVPHAGWDTKAVLYSENGKILHETSFYQSRGEFLDYNAACKEVTAYVRSLKSNFSDGYIWREYQSIV